MKTFTVSDLGAMELRPCAGGWDTVGEILAAYPDAVIADGDGGITALAGASRAVVVEGALIWAHESDARNDAGARALARVGGR